MSERFRWRIAHLLDRTTRQCWADLVSWALEGTRRRGLPVRNSSASCRREAREGRDCYCGQFRTRSGGGVSPAQDVDSGGEA
jgi:hypothetical protein